MKNPDLVATLTIHNVRNLRTEELATLSEWLKEWALEIFLQQQTLKKRHTVKLMLKGTSRF